MNQKKRLRMSELHLNLKLWCCTDYLSVSARQRHQFRVFEQLLQLVPGLRDCILDGTPEEVSDIAKLVSLPKYHTFCK